MSLAVLLVLVSAVVLVSFVALAGAVRADGYGRRPPPRSHPHWDEGWRWR
ncbi:MAG TPA: hypothetical protein PKB06_05485 [Actinotalea sp.]|nr:hypothetical protein [Actinotalea sp.]